MTAYLSNKLKVISLALMLMVVMLHSYNIDIKQGGVILQLPKDFNWVIQNFISNGITRIAVPLFFIISGYLFVSVPGLNLVDIRIKISKRFRTLVIPYFFWVLAGILIYFILQSIPASQPFFTKKLVKDFTAKDWLEAIFTDPIPYQLWFLRDLIIMVVLSPLLYNAVRYLKLLLLFIILPFWLLNQDTVFLTSEGLLFFSIGLHLGEKKVNPEVTTKYSWLLIFVWMILLTVYIAFKYHDYTIAQLIVYKVAIITGIPAFWVLYDKIYNNKPCILNKFVHFAWLSFFIYVFHEPFLTIVKKGLFAFVPKTSLYYLVVYIVAPAIVILVSVCLGFVLKKVCMPFYNFITGGR